MKNEIHKANGLTFCSSVAVYVYATQNHFRITNTTMMKHNGKTIIIYDLCSI